MSGTAPKTLAGHASAASQRRLRGLLWLLLAYLVARHVVVAPWNWIPVDFDVYYRAAQSALEGRSPYINPEAPMDAASEYVYPTFFLAIVAPLTWLPHWLARKAWWALGATALLLAAWGASRWLGKSAARGEGPLARLGVATLAAAVGVVGFLPAAYALLVGQIDILIGPLIALTLWLCALGRRRAAGAAFALTILCKTQPILLLPALAPALGWAGLSVTASVGALYVAALLATGLYSWELYLFTEKIPYWAEATHATTISVFHELTNVAGMDPAAALRISGAAEFGFLGVYAAGLVWMWRRRAHWLWFAAWGAACVLPVSRFLQYHHVILLGVALVVLIAYGERSGRAEPLAWVISSYLLINAGQLLHSLAIPAGPAFCCYGGIALAACGVARGAWRDTAERGSAFDEMEAG